MARLAASRKTNTLWDAKNFKGKRAMTKFRFLVAACAAIATFALSASIGASSALAQSKTLKIIVPYTPGSGPDIISRMLGEQIGKAGGPTVVVESRPGGGMTIGTEAAARAEPDGNTV